MHKPSPSTVPTLPTDASRSIRYEKPSNVASPPAMEAIAPKMGIPAARNPANTSTSTSRLIGNAISSPLTRSFSTWPVIASNRMLPPLTIPVAPGTAAVISADSCSNRACVASSDSCSYGRSGSRVADTRKPLPSPAINGAAAGELGPPGTASGSTTEAIPGIASRSARAVVTGPATAGSAASAFCTIRLSDGPVVLAAVRISRPVVDSLGTVASPAFSRANRPSPTTPVAAAKPAMINTIQTATIRPGRRAIPRPSAASTPSPHVHLRSQGPIRLGPTQHLAGGGRDFADAEEQEAQQVRHRVALGPLEVDVGLHPVGVPKVQQQRGDRVGDDGAGHLQHPAAVADGTVHVQLATELRRVGQGDLEEDHRILGWDVVLLALLLLLEAERAFADLVRVVRDQLHLPAPIVGEEAGRDVVQHDLAGPHLERAADPGHQRDRHDRQDEQRRDLHPVRTFDDVHDGRVDE